MAYSDYGGFAYRNGVRVEDRSDAVIGVDMVNHGQPGVWPGFVAHANGKTPEEAQEQREMSVDGHVVLGDGPVLVSMYKQTSLRVFVVKDGALFPQGLAEIAVDLPPELLTTWEGKPDVNTFEAAEQNAGVLRFEIEGHQIEAVFEQTDNFYQFARLTQPDGTVWTGFSGYGVGAGLEDGDHGYSTEACVERLETVFDKKEE